MYLKVVEKREREYIGQERYGYQYMAVNTCRYSIVKIVYESYSLSMTDSISVIHLI